MDPLYPTDPPRVGKYRLTARLGAGGMGQVYLARTSSGRQVVIKVIRPELASEVGFRARFAREADTARRVGGFHTAQVVDADPNAEPPWIATAHIPGPTLTQAVREHGPVAAPALYVLAAGLTEGLDAIHRCDLVHRDLKPGNIILASDGPRIIDFGIARPLDADSMTTHGAVFGTLPYMSPEQTDSSRVGPASDVFSLGTVLAFAATGTNPFSGATMAATLRRLLSTPPDPGDLDPTIHELITDCWNHEPDQRPTPQQILARFETHDLHASWPPSHTARPGPVTALPAAAPVPDLGRARPLTPDDPRSATDLVEAPQHDKAQAPPRVPRAGVLPQPDVEKVVANRENSKSNRGWYVGTGIASATVTVVLGLLLWNGVTGDDDTAQPENPQPENPQPEGAQPEGEQPKSAEADEPILTLNLDNPVNSVAFSPDGDTLATGGTDGFTGLWDVATGERITDPLTHDDSVNSVAFSPDGETLATGSTDGLAQLWDVATGDLITELTHDGSAESVVFSPDGATLATGSWDGTAQLWDVAIGERITDPLTHDGGVNAVVFSPDGETLATGSTDGLAQLWDVATGDLITELLTHDDSAHSVVFSPDGATLATGSWDGTAQLWDTVTGERITDPLAHDGGVNAVVFSPDGDTLATGSHDGLAQLWNVP